MRAAWFALAIACSGGIFSSLAPLPGKGFNCPGKGRILGTSTTATGFGGSGSGSALWKVRSSYGASSLIGLVAQAPSGTASVIATTEVAQVRIEQLISCPLR
jgi:hypothetical protein